LALVLAHEGGYVNHPADPGGPTNHGVTQRVYDAYRKLHGQSVQSVKAICTSEVEEIYRKQYWRNIRGDDLPSGLDYAVFDFAVNSGIARAVRYLQRAVGVKDDAVMGDETLSHVIAAYKANPEKLITQYCANRLAFMQGLSIYATFGKGWFRRVMGAKAGYQLNDDGVIDLAIKMAGNSTFIAPLAAIGAIEGEIPAKAVATDNCQVDENTFPTMSIETLESIASFNDTLAMQILADKIV
jgi:lysozyme family protein